MADLLRLERENPFGGEASCPDVVRFVTIMSKAGRVRASLPLTLPPSGRWLVRVIAAQDRFVVGLYRRHMRTIGYLGQIDKLADVPVTTRNWNTIVAIVRILKDRGKKGRGRRRRASSHRRSLGCRTKQPSSIGSKSMTQGSTSTASV